MQGRTSAARRRLACWFAAAVAVVLGAPAATTAEIAVTSTEDSRVCDAERCTIRGALLAAAPGETIRVPAGEYQLTLGPLVVERDVTIVGVGDTTIRAQPQNRTLVIGNPQLPAPTVVLSRMQVAGGYEPYNLGGNILSSAKLTLDHVRVTGGRAGTGGGVASTGGGALLVTHSLIDANQAFTVDGFEVGGGIYSDASAGLTMRDSTIAYNGARAGAGVAVLGGAASLERVTLARNHAAGSAPGGLLVGGAAAVTVGGSILAENTAELASLAQQPSNCGDVRPLNSGGNLAFPDDCGFGSAGDPGLSAELVDGFGPTPVLTIPAGSPAVDLAGGCAASDQRDLARPQGVACDAGAFEVAAPVIAGGPSGTTSDASPSFAFASDQPGTNFECRLDGPAGVGAWEPCVSPKGYAGLAPGSYAFFVRPAGASAQAGRAFTVIALAPAVQPPPVPAPTPSPAPTPQPEYRRSVTVKLTKGTVKVRLPGTTSYVDLDALERLPLGSSIDVRKGRVRLYAISRRGEKPQAASFYGGVFRVVQRGSVIELQLRGPKPRCSFATARAADAKPRKKKARKRRLWGSGKGRFRTRGQYSAATVRGTTWLVEDSCRSTTTRVKRGSVTVRDFRLRKTIVLRKGDRYVARRR